MTTHPSHADVHAVITELDQLHHLARADGVRFTFPVLFYGVAGIVSAVTLAWTPLWLYTAWWILVAVVAPPLIARHYGRWLRTRGIGINSRKAVVHVAAAETLALLLWIQPYHSTSLSLPWLALALGALITGRTWHDTAMHVLAAGVATVVAVAAMVATPMALTDAVIGVWLCGVSPWWQWRTSRVRAGQLRFP
jgi:hypothetical protein